MRRFFGGANNGAQKAEAASGSLAAATERADTRAASLAGRIAAVDSDLARVREQLRTARPNAPGTTALRQRAKRLLQQRRALEAQREQLQAQSFNMEQTHFALDSVRDAQATAAAMKDAAGAMRAQLATVSLSKVEDLHDDLQDLLLDANDVQEILSRSYAMPDDIDDADLESELDALGDDIGVGDAAPSYLSATAPTAVPAGADLSGAAAVPSADPTADLWKMPSVPLHS